MTYQDQIKKAQAGPEYARAREAAAGIDGQVVAVMRSGQFVAFHAVRSTTQPHGIRPQAWLTKYRGRWVLASGPKSELRQEDEVND